MTRNRGKKALYEVMSKARTRQDYGKVIEPVHPKKTEERKPVAKPSKAVADWWKKPRIAQFIEGRLEFSVPYQAAIAIGLLFVLLLLGSYRLGQNSIVPSMVVDKSVQKQETVASENSTGPETANIEQPSLPVEKVVSNENTTPIENVNSDVSKPDVSKPVVEKEVQPEKPKGKNAIVLAHSGKYADLVPVVEHFAEHGIDLEIVPLKNGQYQLRTVERYVRNPAIPGTAGFEAKVKIIDIGKLYKGKAPAGLDTFAPNYFSDAYGDNVED